MLIDEHVQDPAVERVLQAFAGEGGGMRTVGGVVRDTQMDRDEVLSVLETHTELFERSFLSSPTSPIFSLKPGVGVPVAAKPQDMAMIYIDLPDGNKIIFDPNAIDTSNFHSQKLKWKIGNSTLYATLTNKAADQFTLKFDPVIQTTDVPSQQDLPSENAK